ncbi:MAG TPA: cytochrome c-type biogenesis CcmF C-terminal domain-containing protein [Gemmatimonadaceae bacterium]|nr:cytochrome c-type biogenesis CcmF C-terminal domain-containing protein [Gemmatimonadaceae bacterium]
MVQLGEFSLWIALLMAAWCATLTMQGAVMRRAALTASGARGLYAALFFLLLASLGLAIAFVTDDFSLRYVALHSGKNVELLYKLCAFWSDTAGELLLASFLVALMGSVTSRVVLRADTDRRRAAWTVAVIGLILAGLIAGTAFGANPFMHLPRAQGDGRGLDPMLRNTAMFAQIPLMLLGAAGAAAACALAAGGAIRQSFDGALFLRLRSAATESWGFLSASGLIAAHWAYVSPGLRAILLKNPAVVASMAAWTILSLFLVGVELAHTMRAPQSEADVMRRRAGRVLAGVGVALCVAAAAVHSRTKNYDVQLGDGEQYSATDAWGHDWSFTSQGASRLERPGDDVISLGLIASRDGVRQPFISTESRQYYTGGGLDVFPAQTVPAVRSSVSQDLLIILSDAGEGRAVLRISFIPLVELDWAGGVLLALGAVLLFWPPKIGSVA